MALKSESVKLMKSKLLLLGLVFSLGSVTGLGQFSEVFLRAGLTKIDRYSYTLNFFVSGSQDIGVIGGTFTIGLWDWAATIPSNPVPLAPEVLGADEGWVSPGLTGTPFQQYGQYSVAFTGTIPEYALYSETTVNITVPKIIVEGVGEMQPVVSLPLTQGDQRVLGVTITIPTDLGQGSWRLWLPDTTYNSLSVPTEDPAKPGTLVFANVVGGDLNYVLGYDGNELTLDVPEPSQFALVGGLALLGFAVWRRSRN